MKKIKTIIDNIKDEMEDAEHYIEYAAEAKVDGDENIYNTAVRLAAVELEHAMMWHNVVVEVIQSEQKKLEEKGIEVPPYMLEMWKEKHEWYIKYMAKLKYELDMLKR